MTGFFGTGLAAGFAAGIVSAVAAVALVSTAAAAAPPTSFDASVVPPDTPRRPPVPSPPLTVCALSLLSG